MIVVYAFNALCIEKTWQFACCGLVVYSKQRAKLQDRFQTGAASSSF